MAEIEQINPTGLVSKTLLNDLRQIIDTARSHVAATAKYEVTMMYWNIGNRINRDVLNYERAEYGKQIVAQLATKLFWSHFVEVLPLKEPLQREFYLTMAATENWGRDTLRAKIDGMLFERTAIATKPEEPGEETPLGLLLCTEGSDEQISLLQLDKSGIRVAQYLTELPSKEVLLRQLQKSIEAAKEIMLLTQSGK